MRGFDRKFGSEFLSQVPTGPGIYEVFDAQGGLVYVGKAKNLRRRLSQYRNAKRRKKHARMKAVVAAAARIELKPCETEVQALLLENKRILEARPKLNIEGAFSFLYPYLGLKRDDHGTFLVLTTRREAFEGFQFFGCFRSRKITKEAFQALGELLEYIGHRVPPAKLPSRSKDRYASRLGFRQIPEEWVTLLGNFWNGHSTEAIEWLVLGLVENAGARRKRRQVQEHLDSLKRFWRDEARPLRSACQTVGHEGALVEQWERDSLMIRARRHSP